MADFNTSITIKGTKEELKIALDFLVKLAEESNAQYREKRDCYYIGESIHVFAPGDRFNAKSTKYSPKEEIGKLMDSLGDTMCLDITGPYGRFGIMDEIDLFELLSEVIPGCSFLGGISGFDAGGDHALKAELKDGLLHLSYLYPHDEWEEDDEDWDDEDWEDDDFPMVDEWDEEKTYDPVAKKYSGN